MVSIFCHFIGERSQTSFKESSKWAISINLPHGSLWFICSFGFLLIFGSVEQLCLLSGLNCDFSINKEAWLDAIEDWELRDGALQLQIHFSTTRLRITTEGLVPKRITIHERNIKMFNNGRKVPSIKYIVPYNPGHNPSVLNSVQKYISRIPIPNINIFFVFLSISPPSFPPSVRPGH